MTLGVEDLERARAFYEALGWSGTSPDGEVSHWPMAVDGSIQLP